MRVGIRTSSLLAGIAMVLAGTVVAGVPASASSGASSDDAVERILGGIDGAIEQVKSPSIASRSNWDLQRLLECIQVESLYYCPLDAWYSEAPSARPRIESIDSRQVTDPTTFAERVRRLANEPESVQRETIQADLIEAREIAGKALADDAMINGRALGPEILDALPSAAAYYEPSELSKDFEEASMPGDMTPMINPVYQHLLISSTSAKKQEKSYYCGPASLAFMSLHDPVFKSKADKYHTQSWWAGQIGTTASSGSNIYKMKDAINTNLEGYKKNVAGYGVFDVSGWSNATWGSRFVNTTNTKKAPILLHPKLTTSNSSYVNVAAAQTGSHYNVGVGYKTDASGLTARVFEPWGGGGNLTSKFYWEPINNIRLQNSVTNSGHQTIAY